MALINTLRNKMGKIVVGAIMVTMVSFILTDLVGNSSILGGGGQNPDIAEMAGQTITNANFQAKVDKLSYNFAINTGRDPVQQETDQIRNQAWNALILESAYQNQFDELGLTVTNEELVDMVQGSNIDPQIRQFFADPQTGEFSRDNIINFLNSVSTAPPVQQASWISFESSLVPNRLTQKYQNLLLKTNYVTKYEAKEEYTNQNASATVEYVYVPFLSVSDSTVSVTDDELEDYLSAHKSEYQREESRSIEYVIFELDPSAADSAIIDNEVVEAVEGLTNSANDSSFVSINSDDPFSFLTYELDNLPSQLKDGDNAREAGYVSTPEIINGNYEFYKLSRVDRITSDSVLYRVAKIRKDFFTSDETIDEVYRKADLFANTVNDAEAFRTEAEAQGLRVLKANRVDRNAQRLGVINQARGIVLWLYNQGEVDKVSDVKEADNQYVVAVMTGVQGKGTANLDDVRNEITRNVRNEKKTTMIIDQLDGASSSDLSEIASAYEGEARSGIANIQMFSNNINGMGYAPEAIGLGFALDEEENTRAFKIQDGVVMIKLTAKNIPADVEDYSSYAVQVSSQRLGQNVVIADFPLTFFRLLISRDIDSSIKEFAEIEDMRYKFF